MNLAIFTRKRERGIPRRSGYAERFSMSYVYIYGRALHGATMRR